ncbi:MAG: DUF502 domain-containing protein [Dehalococcoidales bacterium]
MKHRIRETAGWLNRNLGAKFGIGLLTIVPFAGTILILYWIFNNIDNILQPLIEQILGQTIIGLGFGITVLLIFLVGFIASNVIGRRLIQYGESAIPWFPIVHQLYDGIKQIMESFSAPKGSRRMQPVLTEFPRKGMRVIGFITNELEDESGKKLLTVFIPTSPNPTSGFLQIVEEKEVVRTPMSIEDALKMIVSAGRVVPQEVVDTLFFEN